MGPRLCCRRLSGTQDFVVAGRCHTAISIFTAISRPALFRLINSRNREGRIPQFMTSVLQGEVVFHLLSVKEIGGKQTKKQTKNQEGCHASGDPRGRRQCFCSRSFAATLGLHFFLPLFLRSHCWSIFAASAIPQTTNYELTPKLTELLLQNGLQKLHHLWSRVPYCTGKFAQNQQGGKNTFLLWELMSKPYIRAPERYIWTCVC